MPRIHKRNRIGKTFLAPNPERSRHYGRLEMLTEQLAKTGERVLGKPVHLAMTVELDGVAVIDSDNPKDFPLQAEGENHVLNVFPDSPIVARIDTDEVVHTARGATELTHDGKYGHQIEIVTRPFARRHARLRIAPEDTSACRPISPIEFAKVLEIVPQLIAYRAPDHGIMRIDYSSVPFKGFLDQANACQFNLNLITDTGENLFADGRGLESPLHICCVLESLEFDKGGMPIYVPSPGAFHRLGRRGPTEPDAHFVGERKALGNFPTYFLRGPNRDVARIEDPRRHKHEDTGGVRTEHRLACPEAVVMVPHRSPSLIIESYLRKHLRGLERYEQMTDAERDLLTPEYLWSIPRTPFPASFEESIRNFKASPCIGQHYGPLRQIALEVLNSRDRAMVAGNTK